jgi:hypothetical protein
MAVESNITKFSSASDGGRGRARSGVTPSPALLQSAAAWKDTRQLGPHRVKQCSTLPRCAGDDGNEHRVAVTAGIKPGPHSFTSDAGASPSQGRQKGRIRGPRAGAAQEFAVSL